MYWSSERLRYEASLRRPRASNFPACNRGAVLNRQRESCRKLLHRTLSLPALVATHRAAAYNINITRVRNTIQMYTLHAVLGAPTKQPPRRVRTHPRSSPQIPSRGRDFPRGQQERGWDQTLRTKNTGGRSFKPRNKNNRQRNFPQMSRVEINHGPVHTRF